MPIIDEISEIAKAVNRVQQKISHIAKDSDAPQYKFASEVHVVEAIREFVVEEGLIMSPFIEPGHTATITPIESKAGAHGIDVIWKQSFILIHAESGQIWPEPITVMAEGADYGDKAVWKGLTGAHKYAWLRLLNIATADDPEADRTMDAPQQRRGKKKAAAKKQTKADQALGSQDVSDLNAWVKKVGPEYVLQKDDYKTWDLWIYAFGAAEKVFGKEEVDSNRDSKFACVDDFKAEHQIVQGDTLRAKDIGPFIEYATKGWYRLQQLQDGEAPVL